MAVSVTDVLLDGAAETDTMSDGLLVVKGVSEGDTLPEGLLVAAGDPVTDVLLDTDAMFVDVFE